IGLVCVAPLVLGTLAYFYHWGTGAPSNYGELITPRPLNGPPFDRLRGKWVLVVFDAPACDPACLKKLYYVHQLRRALGEDMDRVERLCLLPGEGKPRADLLRAIEGTKFFYPKDSSLASSLAENPVDYIYLVDPLGNLMMRYPRDADPSEMLKDLQRLMKVAKYG